MFRRAPGPANKTRVNHEVRLNAGRLINEHNEQGGVVDTRDAQRMAEEAGLDLVEVEADVRAAIAEAAAAYPDAIVSVRRILLAEPLLPLDGGRRLADLLCAHASRIMGEAVVAKGVPLYTDARHYAAAGIPIVLYGAGPHTIQEANAHRADERLPLDDLYKATQVVALTLCDLLTETR